MLPHIACPSRLAQAFVVVILCAILGMVSPVEACGNHHHSVPYEHQDVSHGYCIDSYEKGIITCKKMYGELGRNYPTCLRNARRVHDKCISVAEASQKLRLQHL
ncbi:uncharacterized protein EV422DRAFT_529994 [Fimicolochytrium jonesii]|uniref:uncharacterized protein n=1 Tax=Fimicolochytrium jonesii TaxID=1396493 RepID=UPI0022FDF7D9|nr:uncharacterized protein EV422DRAFT_529994 [Fimicolochytrium jonesii]KAI8820747.1 hypothetical protein EV422DRAFT_529994 [Fimicolochytrium jonesii]